MNTEQTAKNSTPNRAYWAQVVTLGLIVGLGLQFAQAWTAPTASAPNGNVSGPITTSGDSQNKQGILGLGGLGVTGATNLNGITTIGAAGTLKLVGKANCDLKTNASGDTVCGPADGNGDITDVTAGTGLTGGGTSGNVTITANTSYLQRRITGTCASGNAIRSINADGTVSCQTTGGVTTDTLASTLYSRSRQYTCDRRANVDGGQDGTKVCNIPAGAPVNQLCYIERTFASDGGEDVNGFGCYIYNNSGTWRIESSAVGTERVMCNARCLY